MRRIVMKLDRDAMTVMLILGLVAMLTLAASAFNSPATANTSTRAVDDALAELRSDNRSAPRSSPSAEGGLILRDADNQDADVFGWGDAPEGSFVGTPAANGAGMSKSMASPGRVALRTPFTSTSMLS